MSSQDRLQYLPRERWCELQSVFKKDWPRGVSGYSVLETQKELLDRGIVYGFRVYCPFGDVESGMVAVNEKKNFYEIIIQCPSDDTGNLGVALRKTKVIDWNRSIIVPFAAYNVVECIKELVQDVNVEIKLILPSEMFILDTKIPYEDVKLPSDMTFDQLSEEHLDLVDSTWPHRYPTSPWYFKLLINNNFGYGLYKNNTLCCWVLINESGNLLHMYTLEGYRKKGYAALLLKLVSNILIKGNKVVTAYCLKDNVTACKLYRKCGFVATEGAAWVYLSSKNKLSV